MRLLYADDKPETRQPTVKQSYSLGEEYVRTAVWNDDEREMTVRVEVIAYATGIRARRNSDGSVDLLGQMSRFDILRENEFMQPVERAVFIWTRLRPGPDGESVADEDLDYCNEIGVLYQDTVEAALANAKHWLNELDFEQQFDPEAWEVPVNG